MAGVPTGPVSSPSGPGAPAWLLACAAGVVLAGGWNLWRFGWPLPVAVAATVALMVWLLVAIEEEFARPRTRRLGRGARRG